MAEVAPMTRQALRTPRAAGIAGIVFSVLLSASLVLIRLALLGTARQSGAWFADPWRRNAIFVALYLVPFAGIAFLWFIGVVRDRIGRHEDRFFATVFLGSGLLFIAMLFVFAAVAGGMAAGAISGSAPSLSTDMYTFSREIVYQLMVIYSVRMAAVFMAVVATITLRTAIMPRWLAYLGYALAVVLLLIVEHVAWVELAFPLWVFLASLSILIADLRHRRRSLKESSTVGEGGDSP
ncbi:MAG TPA: hypothetical protein VFY89_08155 [Ktedonobacterales bacterium]